MSTNDRIEAPAKVGRWQILAKGPKGKGNKTRWISVCECGTFALVFDTHLRRGSTLSCQACALVSHGLTRTPTWRSWESMRARCFNPNHEAYEQYGGRGIGVCERWNSFEAFLEDMGLRPEGTTIDRIDNDQGYNKGNCRWATSKQQNNNRSNNALVEYKGATYTVAQLAERLGMNYQTLRTRIRLGTPLDQPLRSTSATRRCP